MSNSYTPLYSLIGLDLEFLINIQYFFSLTMKATLISNFHFLKKKISCIIAENIKLDT